MARPLDQDRRRELLEGALVYISEHGLVDLSLRPLAEALGTSSRMLIHYFGTKEELLIRAFTLRRTDLRTMLDVVVDLPGLRRAVMDYWYALAVGDEVVESRVLLQILGAACANAEPYATYAKLALHETEDELARVLVRLGRSAEVAELESVGVASTLRGLLFEHCITGDIDRTSRVLEAALESQLRD